MSEKQAIHDAKEFVVFRCWKNWSHRTLSVQT